MISAFYGQLIPEYVLAAPALGAYNLHPSDTQRGIRGPHPFLDTLNSGITQPNGYLGKVVVHELSPQFDTGKVLIETPGLPLRDATGSLPENPMAIGFKFCIYVFPVIIDALLNALVQHGGTFDPFELRCSDALLSELESYRYSDHIGFSEARDLLDRMRRSIRLNDTCEEVGSKAALGNG